MGGAPPLQRLCPCTLVLHSAGSRRIRTSDLRFRSCIRGPRFGSVARNMIERNALQTVESRHFGPAFGPAPRVGPALVLRWSCTPKHPNLRPVQVDPGATAFLLVELTRDGRPVWAVKWRSADGARVKRRMNRGAWMRRGADGRWAPRSGRPQDGELTEFRARRLMPQFVADVEAELAAKRSSAAPSPQRAKPTFRELAHAWLAQLETVDDAKPSTLSDYRALLREPDVPYQRGGGPDARPDHAPARRPPCRRHHAGAHRRAADRARQAADLAAHDQQAPSDPPRRLQLQPFPGSARPLGRRAEPRHGHAQAPRRGPGAPRGLHRRRALPSRARWA